MLTVFRSGSFKAVLLTAGVLIAIALWSGSSMQGGPTAGWKTNFDRSMIDLKDVVSGGVPRDGIPPIDNPQFTQVQSVNNLSDNSPVIVVNIGGDARAYPLEVLTRHEIVNDLIADIPIAVTFCPLCNSALVYKRQVDGKTLRFGVSGNLLNSDLIMWDDATESWWQQLTGDAIAGDFSGMRLEFVTSQLVGFGVFGERYPEGKVLRGPFGAYGRNPYPGYDSSKTPFLFRGPVDERLHPTERVLAAKVAGEPAAFPFSLLRQNRVVNQTIGNTDFVIFWRAGAVSALDKAEIDQSRDVGMALMYERQLENGEALNFSHDGSGFLDKETGSRWNIFGEAIDGPLSGTALKQMHAAPHFWFAWAVFNPETLLPGDQPDNRSG